MKIPLLACLAVLASSAAFSQAPSPAPVADTAAERAELLSMFAGPAGLGVVQVAKAGSMVRTVVPLFPAYHGLESDLSFKVPDILGRIEKVSAPAAGSDIEAPDDLRDALGAMPSPVPPGAAHLPPLALLKAGLPEPVPAGPAGWLVLTRADGREVRPLKTADEVKRWTSVAELQRRAYEALVLERFSKNLDKLGSPE